MAKSKKTESLFERAKKNATVETAKEKASSKGIEVKQLRTLAHLGMVIKALQSVYDSIEPQVKDAGTEAAIDTGMQAKHQPENFDLFEGNARAGFQLRKRSSRSKLKEEEIGLLREHNISIEKVVEKEPMFAFNKKYSEDQAILSKIDKKLSSIPDLPEDLIVMQSEVSYEVTSDNSIEEVFSKVSDREKVKMLLQVVATTALKLNLDSGDISEAIEEAFGLLEKK